MFCFISIFCSYFDFVDQNIYIRFSRNDDYKIVEYLKEFGETPFRAMKKSMMGAMSKYVDISRITRVNSQYMIKIGAYFLCKKEMALVKCEENIQLWDIKENKFGFTISSDNKCLKITRDLSLNECSGLYDEFFIFQERPGILECLDLLKSPYDKPDTLQSKRNRAAVDRALKNLNEITEDSSFADEIRNEIKNKVESMQDVDKYIENMLPEAKDKTKIKKVIDALYDNAWNVSWFRKTWRKIRDFFCP